MATYYDNVRVPHDMLVGELHGGWKLITAQLNHERLGLGAWSDKVVGLFRRVLMWSREADENGVKATDKAWVRAGLAQCYARLEAIAKSAGGPSLWAQLLDAKGQTLQ